MSEPTSPQVIDETGARPAGRRRWIGFTVGVGLLAAAVVAVARHGDGLSAIAEAAGRASWATLAMLAILPIVNCALTGGVFYSLTRLRGRVGLAEMLALIGASWLLNYLPFSPGLLGRIAYHRRVNGIPVTASVRVAFEAIGCSWVGGLLVLGDQVLRTHAGLPPLIGVALLPAVLGLWIWSRRSSRLAWTAALAVAVALKYCDTLVWTFRYWLLFEIVGVGVTPAEAAAIAVVAQMSMLVPGLANGLGLREWVVGLLGAALPAFFGGEGFERGAGLAADLLNRGVELAAALAVGFLCAAWLRSRHLSGQSSGAVSSGPDGTPTS